MRFDPLIAELEDEVSPRYPAVALLDVYWLDRLPTLLDWAREIPHRLLPRLALHLDVRDARAHQDDWSGDLELWPGGEHSVLIRRVPLYDEGLAMVTLAAARSRADIDQALGQLTALRMRWRREQARGSTGDSREVRLRDVAWDDVCLPGATLSDVRTTVEAFGRSREAYRRWSLPYRRGILFHGPPGNGKTMLCRAIVSALGWPVVFVDGSDNQHGMRHAFSEAEELAPAVICFEDVDSLFSGQAALSAFLNRLDGFETEEGLLVLATTNHPEKLDPALTSRPSRFDRVYQIGDPEPIQRERYLGRLFGASLSEEALAWLASETEGMSMAFLKEIFVSAALRATARGAADPTLEDVRAGLPALLQHRRSATKAFQPVQAVGFGAR